MTDEWRGSEDVDAGSVESGDLNAEYGISGEQSSVREDLVELTLELLATDTANPPGDTREIASFVESYLAVDGIELDRHTVDPAKPNVVATIPGETDRTVLFNGHFDTVPYDADEWTYDPLGELVDDRVYGRGATDMKGPLASMLYAARTLASADGDPPVTVEFAFVSDEEIGGDAGLTSMLEADALRADACVIGEPTCEGDRHSVTVADRGSIWLTMVATGDAAHGSRPVLGVNAIDRLYDAVRTLRDEFGARALEIDPEVGRIVDESVEYYGPSMGETTARELFEYPTINLGTIEGGEAINSVPQTARATLDVRLTAGTHTPDVLSDIRACAADCEGVELTDVSWSVGTAEAIDSPLVDSVASVAGEVTGDRIYRRSATGGGDAKKLRNAGIPTVEFALGTDTVHAVDEYVTVEALLGNAEVYGRLPGAWYQSTRSA